ncbi:hypothetical protein [Nocardioides humi]|uniref:Transposase n=1 Tax=Nocardioides humi TaxID=449461 RepID=A0ABN2BI11_9ACTN|nr:hypothetical protein [Nocardioides humi]
MSGPRPARGQSTDRSLGRTAGLLDQGIRFVVRDHDSGGDRTDEVLAQVLGRRVRGGSAPTDLISGLLRAPGQIAQQLVGEAAPAPEPTKAKAKKGKKKGQKGPKKAKDQPSARDAELAELRAQVAELTQAVSILVQDRLDERAAAQDDDA